MQPELQTSLWFARVLDDSLRLADPTLEQVLLLTPHLDPEVVTAKFAEVRGRGTRGRMECAGSPLPR